MRQHMSAGVSDAASVCSEACRRRRLTSVDVRLEELLRALLDRGGRAGVDPDQAARCVVNHPSRTRARTTREIAQTKMMRSWKTSS